MLILSKNIEKVQRKARREAESYAVLALLRQHYGEDVQLGHKPNGAPYLPGKKEYISISHTDGRVVLALSSQPIGIDLERISPRIAVLTPRILSPDIAKRVEQYTGSEQEQLHHILWTASEALFKLVEESSLISDFDCLLDTLVWNKENNAFSLEAVYKKSPEVKLGLQGYFEGEYILTTARYL